MIGFDVDDSKVDQLRSGRSYIKHIASDWIADVTRRGDFRVTSDFSLLREADCISICVPTPLNKNREPNLEYIERTSDQLRQCLRPGQLIILESTTYPGTTEELVQPCLEKSGLLVGHDIYLAFSPEREDPGERKI